MRFLYILLITFTLPACSSLKPMHDIFDDMPKNAPPAYQQGWKEGCESGLSVKSNAMYQTFYHLQQTQPMISNPYYYKAWKSAFDYCRARVYGRLKEAGLRGAQPNAPHKQTGLLDWMNNWGPGVITNENITFGTGY